jgi:N-methylhydantoinase A
LDDLRGTPHLRDEPSEDAGRIGVHGEFGSLPLLHLADVCFIGQSSYVSVPLASGDPSTMLPRLYEDFLLAHERIYGHSSREPARIVNLRSVHGIEPGCSGERSDPEAIPSPAGGSVPMRSRAIWLPGAAEPVYARIIERTRLVAGEHFHGPALVEQVDTTTLVPSGWSGEASSGGELILVRRQR